MNATLNLVTSNYEIEGGQIQLNGEITKTIQNLFVFEFAAVDYGAIKMCQGNHCEKLMVCNTNNCNGPEILDDVAFECYEFQDTKENLKNNEIQANETTCNKLKPPGCIAWTGKFTLQDQRNI